MHGVTVGTPHPHRAAELRRAAPFARDVALLLRAEVGNGEAFFLAVVDEDVAVLQLDELKRARPRLFQFRVGRGQGACGAWLLGVGCASYKGERNERG